MTLTHILAAAVFVGTACHSMIAFAEQLGDIKAEGTLNGGVPNNSPPLGFQDPKTREPTGYEIEICQMLAKYLGVTPKLIAVSPQARMAELAPGLVDRPKDTHPDVQGFMSAIHRNH